MDELVFDGLEKDKALEPIYGFKKMVRLAKEVVDLNKNISPAVTGSLMLKLRGYDIGREPVDLDIIVSELYNTKEGRPIVPEGFKLKSVDSGSSPESMKYFDENGFKIEFLFSVEDVDEVDGIPLGGVRELLLAKIKYGLGDNNENSRKKHLNDIIKIISQSVIIDKK